MAPKAKAGQKRKSVTLSSEELVVRQRSNVSDMCDTQHAWVLAKIVERLEQDFDEAVRVHLILESGGVSKVEVKEEGTKRYRSQNKFRLMPKTDMVDILNRMKHALGNMVDDAEGKPTELLSCLLNVDPHSAIFSKVVETNKEKCLQRYREQGEIAQHWDGTADSLRNFSFFELMPGAAAGEKVHAVKHVFSGAVAELPEEDRCVEWRLWKGMSFSDAVLKCGLRQVSVQEIFEHAHVHTPNGPMKLDEVVGELPSPGKGGTCAALAAPVLAAPALAAPAPLVGDGGPVA